MLKCKLKSDWSTTNVSGSRVYYVGIIIYQLARPLKCVWNICASDAGVWLICPRAFQLLFELGLCFIQITANPTCQPARLSTETTFGLKSIPKQWWKQRRVWGRGGWSNRWGSLILLDIYLGCTLSTMKQNLGHCPQPGHRFNTSARTSRSELMTVESTDCLCT